MKATLYKCLTIRLRGTKTNGIVYLYSTKGRNVTASITFYKWKFQAELSLWYVGTMLVVERQR